MAIMFSIIRYIQIILPSFPCPNKTNSNYFFIINELDLLSRSFGSAELWKLNHRSALGQHSRGSAASECSILVKKKKTKDQVLKMQLEQPEEKLSVARAVEHQNPGKKLMGVCRIPRVCPVFVWGCKTLGRPQRIPTFASRLRTHGCGSPWESAALKKEKRFLRWLKARLKRGLNGVNCPWSKGLVQIFELVLGLVWSWSYKPPDTQIREVRLHLSTICCQK